MTSDRGFVLLNALVLVAAMSAAAVFVMAQAETGRARLVASQTADQLDHYLDAFEAYAMAVLLADPPSVTAEDGAWRIEARALDVDRGQVSGSMIDVESKLNLNWLAGGNSPGTVDLIDRALIAVNARSQVTGLITAAMSPGVPDSRPYLSFDPPRDPVGGMRTLPVELRDIAGLTPSDLEKLALVATLAPPDSTLNVNTASVDVVAAFFPDLSRAQVEKALSARNEGPFTSVDAFLERVEDVLGSALGDDVDVTRLSVSGVWFQLTTVATLDGQTARRETMLERRLNGLVPRVIWRVTQYP